MGGKLVGRASMFTRLRCRADLKTQVRPAVLRQPAVCFSLRKTLILRDNLSPRLRRWRFVFRSPGIRPDDAVIRRIAVRSVVGALNFARAPLLLDPRIEWSIEPQSNEEPLPRNRLQPVVFETLRRLGAKVEVERAILIRLDPVRLTPDARERLTGLELGSSLRVVHRHGRVRIVEHDPSVGVHSLSVPSHWKRRSCRPSP